MICNSDYDLDISYCECSARDDDNVQEIMRAAVRKALETKRNQKSSLCTG